MVPLFCCGGENHHSHTHISSRILTTLPWIFDVSSIYGEETERFGEATSLVQIPVDR